MSKLSREQLDVLIRRLPTSRERDALAAHCQALEAQVYVPKIAEDDEQVTYADECARLIRAKVELQEHVQALEAERDNLKQRYDTVIKRLRGEQELNAADDDDEKITELRQVLRLVLSRAQVDRMMELQRQGFTGTIHKARERGLMPREFEPALELLELATSEKAGYE